MRSRRHLLLHLRLAVRKPRGVRTCRLPPLPRKVRHTVLANW